MFDNKLQGGIIYQIMPDRFFKKDSLSIIKESDLKGRIIHNDFTEQVVWKPDEQGIIRNNDFFGGNLAGIESKIPYIADLGVSFIYLNPIFRAYSNHRYDTANYLEIDPLLGTEEDFKSLCVEAKKFGIGIILDGVFAHTGSDSLYFNKENNYNEVGAYNSKQSRYYNWYKFRNYPDSYDSWWGFSTLPQTNQECKEYRDFICNEVIPKWMNLGAAGFRLDVVDELKNYFIVEICNAIHSKGGFVIGEVWENAATKCAYDEFKDYFDGNKLDSVMNYLWKDGIIDYVRYGTDFLKRQINEVLITYPKKVVNNLMNILSTHDIERAITAIAMPHLSGRDRNFQYDNHHIPCSEYDHSKRLLKLATVLQYFLPGVPSIYYGDEIGMSGYKDPFNRYPFAWDDIDRDLLLFFKELGHIRCSNKFLAVADFELIYYDCNYVTFRRSYEEQNLFICLNRSEYSIFESRLQRGTLIYSNNDSRDGTTLAPFSFAIFTSPQGSL